MLQILQESEHRFILKQERRSSYSLKSWNSNRLTQSSGKSFLSKLDIINYFTASEIDRHPNRVGSKYDERSVQTTRFEFSHCLGIQFQTFSSDLPSLCLQVRRSSKSECLRVFNVSFSFSLVWSYQKFEI